MLHCFKKARDPISSWTHFLGAVGAGVGTIILFASCLLRGAGAVTLFSCLVFGFSMLALYNASAIYHYVHCSPQKLERFRKADHSMIYVLIAGSYTPICLRFMQPPHGAWFTAVMWGLALCGILIKVCWLNAPRWLYTAVYLLMGWAIIFDLQAFRGMPAACFGLIAAGGVAYSAGAVIYMLKKPNFKNGFGFHEIFHVFIMLGTLFHFFAVYLYMI
ncbi:MAG: hemolysin III family protein [Oscillospiraceae bacterium]|nr:hemolysin III family protein [Oscillospiraceae bacterium]